MTLNYMSPIWIAGILFAMGLYHGKVRFEWKLVCAIVASFIGVVLREVRVAQQEGEGASDGQGCCDGGDAAEGFLCFHVHDVLRQM